jgi:biotin carboxyl carrier protein
VTAPDDLRPRRATLAADGTAPLERTPDVAGPELVAALARAGLPHPIVQRLPGSSAERATGQVRLEVVTAGWRFEVMVEDAARAALRDRAGRADAAAAGPTRLVVRAQIPGRVVSVGVRNGQSVEAGQRLLSVEAMKMENEIRAQRAGRVERVAVEPGQRVERGDELAVLV